MAIKCCNGCVPPKRNAYCHSYCPEYTEENAQHKAEKAEEAKKKQIKNSLDAQAIASVNRINKKKRRMKGRC